MKKILIVDDQEKIRNLVTVTLRDIGDYQILQAGSVEEALAIAKAERPDLIIMDVMMPGKIDGLTATRTLKSDACTKDSVLILLTAMGQEVDKEAGFSAGADDYFVKPFSPVALIRKVEEILGGD
jgi:CheY-like chemotaxis protein